jgi:hypothetical protein
MWAKEDFQEYVVSIAADCYNSTVSFSTLPSGKSRLAWEALLLVGFVCDKSLWFDVSVEAYRRAILISTEERRVARTRGKEDHAGTPLLVAHHRHLAIVALKWDPPHLHLAKQGFEFGE